PAPSITPTPAAPETTIPPTPRRTHAPPLATTRYTPPVSRANPSTATLSVALAIVLGQAFLSGACGGRSSLAVPCDGQTGVMADLAPLSVVIMVDNSGSMAFSTESWESRQQAVAASMVSFFAWPETEGTSVSLTNFPIVDPSVPETCASDAACGLTEACQPLRMCLPSGSLSCETSADCEQAGFPGDTCELIGSCDDGSACALGLGCTDGECTAVDRCDNRNTCTPQPYETPRVPMTPLPDGVILLSAALTSHPPAGARPTLPALVGSVSQALAWSDAHPGDTTVVVLATDGLPTACDPAIHEGDATLAIEHLADAAAVGVAGGVLTYVIGIEAPAEGTAREGLDAIAAAGGTERALVVNASFGDELTDTLADVWLDASGCTFDAGLDETEVDHRDARVRLLLANGERPYVSWRAAPADCGDGPGFYVAPNPPHHVVLCPASCDRFGPSFSRTIEVFTSCSMVAGR
ncbi:MAG: hypothetical protein RIF41_37730, partial [Polyangiaceae bacterium]